MKIKILLNLGMTLVVLFAAQAAFGITIKLSDRKLITNDDKDDSVPVQKAFNDLLAAGGGTIEFPSGVTDIKNVIRVFPNGFKPVNVIIKGDGGSIIRIALDPEATAFDFGNLNRLQVENLVFTGKPGTAEDPDFIDAKFIILAGYINLIKLTNTSFFGIAVPSGGAIVHAASNLTIDNCQFEGNSAGYPDGAAVNLDCCSSPGQNANIRNTTFIDYANFNGQHFSKTGAMAGQWVRVKQVFWEGDTSSQRLTIEDSFFDEGAAVAVNVENIASVHLKGIRVNVNSTPYGTALKADNVRRIRIEDSDFGLSALPRPFAILADSSAEMIGVSRSHDVQCPQADGETTITWRLSDCN